MSALQEINLIGLSTTSSKETIRQNIALMFWLWYAANLERSVKLPVKLFKVSFTVSFTIRKLRPVFVLLFGENKESTE